MVIKGTCPNRSYTKQLQAHHTRYQSSLSFFKFNNFGHEPSQISSTSGGFDSRDLQVFAEVKPPIQLHLYVLDTLFHTALCFPRKIFGYLKNLLSVTSKASVFPGAISRHMLSNQRYARHRLSLILSSRILMSGSHPRPLRGTAFHLSFKRLFVALVYHPPVDQIVIYHSQQVVWNLFPHHPLDADVPPRGIERIAYVNANQRTESLTNTSSFSCICGDVNHSLDGVHSGPAFLKAVLIFRKTLLADHVTL